MAKIILCFISVAILVQYVSFGQQLRTRQQRSMALSQDCKEPGTVYGREDCLNCRPTCKRPQGSPNCTLDTCAMGCVCPEGYTRHPLYVFSPECIPLAECPKCPPNEVYDDGMTELNNCAPTCEKPGPHLMCNMMAYNPISCTCADGLVRNQENNKCIPVKECPNQGSDRDFPKFLRRPFDDKL
ncbi:trypsin inhibitor like cysteine rich domain-containing protein [Ditylenchus destructor]|nr:trypsin inhibitor like cysteine rich domain-containing protein [Ditylenchus destructor]